LKVNTDQIVTSKENIGVKMDVQLTKEQVKHNFFNDLKKYCNDKQNGLTVFVELVESYGLSNLTISAKKEWYILMDEIGLDIGVR
jgi:hypothetical protein